MKNAAASSTMCVGAGAFMDEVLLGKAAIIERCLKRVHQEYDGRESELETNFTQQDALLLNLQRACEAAIDGAMHLVRIDRLGLPNDSRQAFTLLLQAGKLPVELARNLEAMVGFRNVAVHNYRELDLNIVRAIITHRLADLKAFAGLMIQRAIGA
jgi:uncharacterized protein YutE (UPF0331/DUF86 family)